jgi:hypothetical protein
MWYALGEHCEREGSDTGQCWIKDSGSTPVYGRSLEWKYFTALHWSITQFTPASMDIVATNLSERIYSVVILLFGLFTMSSVIANISTSMTYLRNIGCEETKQLWLLRRYLKEKKIEWTLKARVIKYAEYQVESKKRSMPADKVALLTILSDPLKRQLANVMCSPSLTHHPLVDYLETEMTPVMHRICQESVGSFSLAENDMVFRSNEAAKYMYFAKSGTLVYTLAGDDTPHEPGLKPKEWISEMVLWTEWRHHGDLQAGSACELLRLCPDSFAGVMRFHPRTWNFARCYAVELARFCHYSGACTISDIMLVPDLVDMVQRSDRYDDTGHRRLSDSDCASECSWTPLETPSQSNHLPPMNTRKVI